MNDNLCSICGKQVYEENMNICINCGTSVCTMDFDSTSGYCSNCTDDFPYCGC